MSAHPQDGSDGTSCAGFPDLSGTAVVSALAVLSICAVVLRIHYFPDSDLPINDGALFYAYTAAILDNGLALPSTVAFNGFTLPFAYPPLSFWLSSWLVSAFGFDLLSVVRDLPFAFNLAYLALFVVFLREVGLPRSIVVLASATFFLSHRSFEYLIMGGGLSRSTGGVFALASLVFASKLVHDPRSRWVIGAAFCCALAILSHLEWGIVSASGTTLILLVYANHRPSGLLRLIRVGGLSALFIAPWVIWVYQHHGLDPFLHASRTSFWDPRDTAFSVLYLDIFPWYLRIFCVLGVWESLKTGRYFWVIFTLSLALLTPRHFDTASLISNSVLAAVGIVHVWTWVLSYIARTAQRFERLQGVVATGGEAKYLVLVAMTTLYVATASYYQLGSVSMGAVTPEAHAAMRWIRGNATEEARFVVVSPDPWYVDEVNEWFPLLANAISLTTVQGTEWVGGGEFDRRSMQNGRLKGLPCPYVADYLFETYPGADFAMVVHRRECFQEDARFVQVFANAGAGVYRIQSARP